MAKEMEKRLIKALEFLKEPQGSTISTIVKAVNGESPQVSLKKIVQTLRGCLENGTLKVSAGRVKLKHMTALQDTKPNQDKELMNGKTKGPDKLTFSRKVIRTKTQKNSNRPGLFPLKCEGEPPPEGGPEGTDGQCPECPKCKKKKKKPKCKPKPKCPKPKPKCPKPKPKCPKPKPKCPKPKPKCKPKKPKCKPKKCSKKIQPYCKKKKKCGS